MFNPQNTKINSEKQVSHKLPNCIAFSGHIYNSKENPVFIFFTSLKPLSWTLLRPAHVLSQKERFQIQLCRRISCLSNANVKTETQNDLGPIHTGRGMWCATRCKQMGPIDVNGGVHTARKQHQRKNILICTCIPRPVWIGPQVTWNGTDRFSVRPLPFWSRQTIAILIPNRIWDRLRFRHSSGRSTLLRPLHTKRQRQLMAIFPSILGIMLSVHKPITFTHGWHWWQYASTAQWQRQRSVWMGLYASRCHTVQRLCAEAKCVDKYRWAKSEWIIRIPGSYEVQWKSRVDHTVLICLLNSKFANGQILFWMIFTWHHFFESIRSFVFWACSLTSSVFANTSVGISLCLLVLLLHKMLFHASSNLCEQRIFWCVCTASLFFRREFDLGICRTTGSRLCVLSREGWSLHR